MDEYEYYKITVNELMGYSYDDLLVLKEKLLLLRTCLNDAIIEKELQEIKRIREKYGL